MGVQQVCGKERHYRLSYNFTIIAPPNTKYVFYFVRNQQELKGSLERFSRSAGLRWIRAFLEEGAWQIGRQASRPKASLFQMEAPL